MISRSKVKFRNFVVLIAIIGLSQYPTAGQTQDAGATSLSNGAAGDEDAHLKDSLTTPIVTAEGHTAMLTCVVRNIGDHTLIWKYGKKILTAGETRVTIDKRYNVIHDKGGDVYVLNIKRVTHRDSGLYVCELDTKPTSRSFHKLTVLTSKLVAPPPRGDIKDGENVSSNNTLQNLWGYTTPSPIDHDYTACCARKKVVHRCIGFCDVSNILEGTTGQHPSECEDDFHKIVECMAAGRNHIPCCERAGVPDLCQDMCVGSYSVQTDDVRSQVSCSAYTAPTLVCIAEGVNILPPQPQELEAMNITDKSFTLKWKAIKGKGSADATTLYQAERDQPSATFYHVNVTKVRTMNPDGQRPTSRKLSSKGSDVIQLKVPGIKTELVVDGLEPYTVYNVTSVTAENAHGKSLPSYALLVLTLSKREMKMIQKKQRKNQQKIGSEKDFEKEGLDDELAKKIPDTRTCCKNHHKKNNNSRMIHEGCIDKFCDPVAIRKLEVTDFMICATWTWDMVSCLVDGKNHEPCCKGRGVPDICSNFCAGNVTADEITFQHFKCQRYMDDISNCLMEGYDVLPSSPENFYFSNIGSTIGLLHWDPPALHADSVTNYRVHYDESTLYPFSNPIDKSLVTIRKTNKSPFILEGLKAGTSYIAYVEAENKYGTGQMSSIAVFRTSMKTIRKRKNKKDATGDNFFKQKECCSTAGVKDECLPMCQFNASISESRRLAPLCKEDFPMITKCAAAGRDHLPCCLRRGVPVECQALCQGTQIHSENSVYGDCFAYIGNIMTCLEDGWIDLPEPVKNFHATFVQDTKVTLSWDPLKLKTKKINDAKKKKGKKSNNDEGDDSKVLQYEIFYKELRNNSVTSGGAFSFDKNINVTSDFHSVTISGLKTNKKHQFFIVSRNEQGTSLPTSVITINISRSDWNGQLVHGRPSPPHEVATSVGADNIVVSWTPPTISDPEDYHKYRLSYGPANNRSTLFNIETSANTATLKNLTSNTQFILYLTTLKVVKNKSSEDSIVQESLPSETIIAWTEPTIQAIAEPPKITPSIIHEGDNFQVLCIGLGNPVPTVSLYLDGHLVRSDNLRHLVTTVFNSSRILNNVGCSASNGKGNADYSEKKLDIMYHPRIVSTKQRNSFHRKNGQMLSIICGIEANPAPTIRFGRTNGEDLEVNTHHYGTDVYQTTLDTATPGDKVDLRKQLRYNKYVRQPQYITLKNNKQIQKDDYYEAILTIRNFQASDSGGYYCTAENDLGSSTTNMSVGVNLSPQLPRHDDLRSCCKNEGIEDVTCLEICTFNLDLDLLSFEDSTGCAANYFSSYMKCGADESDHRQCCRNNDVPRGCWDFCRGRTPSVETAAATGLVNGAIDDCMPHMRTIGKCFQEGQYALPGPPTNLQVTPINANSAVASWDPPIKNPNFAEVYRLIWRKPGDRAAQKLDTEETTVTLNNLTPSVEYELVVKAGNSNGTSVLSPPITFVVADKFIIQTNGAQPSTDIVFVDTSALIGGLLSVFIILVIALLAVMWYRRHPVLVNTYCPKWTSNWGRSSNGQDSPSRSFANNMFNQEITMSTLEDTINDSYIGTCNDPPPYSIAPEIHTNNESCETTDHTENEPDKTKNKPTTSAKNILGETFERFRRTGESNHGAGFQRFQ